MEEGKRRKVGPEEDREWSSDLLRKQMPQPCSEQESRVGIQVNDLVPTVREDLNDGYCMSKELHEIVRAYDWYKKSEHMQIRELLPEPRSQGVPQAFLDVASERAGWTGVPVQIRAPQTNLR